MADQLTDALGVLVAICPHIRATRDLVTKIRVELEQDYLLDLYHRESTGQYSYTVVLNDQPSCLNADKRCKMNWEILPHDLLFTHPAMPPRRHNGASPPRLRRSFSFHLATRPAPNFHNRANSAPH